MGKSIAKSSVDGTLEISNAVIFAVLTTVVAFAPLMFVKGVMGKFFWVIPAIIITVLLMSLVESLLILPAHLSGGLIKTAHRSGIRLSASGNVLTGLSSGSSIIHTDPP